MGVCVRDTTGHKRMKVGAKGKEQGRDRMRELCIQINPGGSRLHCRPARVLTVSSPFIFRCLFFLFSKCYSLNYTVKRQKKNGVLLTGPENTLFCLHGRWEGLGCAADEECG